MDGSSIKSEERPDEQEKTGPKEFFGAERYDPRAILPFHEKPRKVVQWRMQQRMKTVSVLLTLCLNIGVDPPDVVKASPCARMECWLDPNAFPPQKAIDQIGKALQMQYEKWQPRARYKLCLDPDDDAVKKLCISLRRNAKDERLLLHYNGHGVPRPTNNGEIWVFNKNYTQYIPLSLYELQTWIGVPSIFVFDCSSAETIIYWFNKFADQREQEEVKAKQSEQGTRVDSDSQSENYGAEDPLFDASAPPSTKSKEYILLASCSTNELLPTSPDLPADVFTACLTTPIQIALRWFCTQTILTDLAPELIERIPGRASDRRTPMGELNWIFTDTIAWNVLTPALFQKLFREDLLVASLFRNYLLAERIMRSCKCTPVSHPALPSTYNHPMWRSWDLCADHCLSQLPALANDPNYEYQHSPFFAQQLTAFEVWLQFGSESKNPPEQLPIVLQVLLSQQLRQKALELLAQFLDLGSWAVNYALSVGIFPYMLKLLQNPAPELRQVLVFIWTKILVLDKSCQFELVKENVQHYFISVLSNTAIPIAQRIQSAFVLSMISNNCRPGQSACLNAKLIKICLDNLNNADSMLRRWVVFCLAKLWENNEAGKREAISEQAHVQLCGLLTDPVPEVRAAAVYALGAFITKNSSHVTNREPRTIIELNLGLTFAVVASDASILVRKELIITLGALVHAYADKFKQTEAMLVKQELVKRINEHPTKQAAASDLLKKLNSTPAPGTPRSIITWNTWDEPCELPRSTPREAAGSIIAHCVESDTEEDDTIYEYLWKGVLNLMNDPYPLFSRMTSMLVAKIRGEVKAELQQQGIRLPAETWKPSPAKGAVPSSSSFDFFGKKQPTNPALVDKPEELKSTLYEWSCLYFGTRLLKNGCQSDEESLQYTERKWRLHKNSEAVKESIALCDQATGLDCKAENLTDLLPERKATFVHSLDNEVAILENNNQLVSQLCFHPFEDVVYVSDEHDGITIWNWKEGVQAQTFANHNPPGTRVTALDLINENTTPLLCCGSDDGVLRIWSVSGDTDSKLKLVTAWSVLDDLIPIRGTGLTLNWQKKRDLLIAAGNTDILKVWDLNKELSTQSIPTESPKPVMCLASDYEESALIAAGFADNTIRLFDRRGSKYSLVHKFEESRGWMTSVAMPKSLNHQLISCNSWGDVKIWDVRQTKQAIKSIPAHNSQTVYNFAVHEYAPVFVVGTQDQRIRVMNFAGEEISLIRYHDGFLGQRIGPISALAFHPHKFMLAAGATDSIVSVYAGDRSQIKI